MFIQCKTISDDYLIGLRLQIPIRNRKHRKIKKKTFTRNHNGTQKCYAW